MECITNLNCYDRFQGASTPHVQRPKASSACRPPIPSSGVHRVKGPLKTVMLYETCTFKDDEEPDIDSFSCSG